MNSAPPDELGHDAATVTVLLWSWRRHQLDRPIGGRPAVVGTMVGRA